MSQPPSTHEPPPAGDPHAEERHDEPKDEAQKSYRTILEQQTEQAEEELTRPPFALLLSAVAAGLDLGVGIFAMAVHTTLTRDVFDPAVQELINASRYSIGFVVVVLGRSELFTEHTTSAVLPVLSRRAGPVALFRLWAIVLAGNLIGSTVVAYGATRLGFGLGIADQAAFAHLAERMVRPDAGTMFLSAVAAGWIMGLLTWLIVSARETIAQIVVIWLTTMVIGLGGLHHAVGGAIEIMLGIFAGQGATWGDLLVFEGIAVAGNVVGGGVFVALLKYGHVTASATR